MPSCCSGVRPRPSLNESMISERIRIRKRSASISVVSTTSGTVSTVNRVGHGRFTSGYSRICRGWASGPAESHTSAPPPFFPAGRFSPPLTRGGLFARPPVLPGTRTVATPLHHISGRRVFSYCQGVLLLLCATEKPSPHV